MNKTQVAIVGAGPAGLLLSQLLDIHGIDSVVLERRSRAYVEGRIRAGVLEQGTVDLLREAGVSARCEREGLVHHGIELALDGVRRHVDLSGLTGGKVVTIYGQTEVTKDLNHAREARGGQVLFEVSAAMPHDVLGHHPYVTYTHQGVSHRLHCDVIVGCDGYHGVCRTVIPRTVLKTYERIYPYAWLGILARCRPAADELIYARSRRGFALFSMRSTSLARNYIQCRPDEDLEAWPDQRVWDELDLRLGGEALEHGEVIDKSITQMRSFVTEPMRHGQLFLAGDAAHIVPPTGAKGLNLAASDVHYLVEGLVEFYKQGSSSGLDHYSQRALARVWKAQRFSAWMTALLHNASEDPLFEDRIHYAEMDYVLSSEAARTTLAENYVGLPY